MAVNIIVYNNNLANTAPGAYWSQLETDLRLDTVIQDSNLTIYLNENGEYSGVSPQTVANLVQNGAVWIDWCGWPFYYNDISSVLAGILGSSIASFSESPGGFGAMVAAMGFPLGYNSLSHPVFAPVPSGIPYVRSLIVSGQVRIPGFQANGFLSSPYYQSGGTYIYPSFAIPYGKGAYIYAFASATPINDPFAIANINSGQRPNSVTPPQYIPFVKQIITSILQKGNASSSAPQCPTVGTYAGATGTAGLSVYTMTKSGVTRRATADGQCTILSSTYTGSGSSANLSQAALANLFDNGSSASGATGVTSSTPRGKCTNFGSYSGPGNDFGTYAGYDVYKQTTGGGYVYNVVNPATCQLIHSYPHSSQVSSAPSQTSGSGSGTSSGSAPKSTTVPPISSTTWLIAGGVALAGAAWFLWPRKE